MLDLIQIHNLVDWRTHLATLRRMEGGRDRSATSGSPTIRPFADRVGAHPRQRGRHRFRPMRLFAGQREAETRLLPTAAARGVAVIVNQPFETGDLFRRVRGRALPEWAAELDCASWAQLFLKYLIAEPAVNCVIPATGNPAHMEDNVKAGFRACRRSAA